MGQEANTTEGGNSDFDYPNQERFLPDIGHFGMAPGYPHPYTKIFRGAHFITDLQSNQALNAHYHFTEPIDCDHLVGADVYGPPKQSTSIRSYA